MRFTFSVSPFIAVATILMGMLQPTPASSAERGFLADGVLMIPAAAFSVSGFDPDGHQFWAAAGYYVGTSTTAGCIKAPVYLPDFAKITSVSATVYDNADPLDIELYLQRFDKTGPSVLTMAELTTSAQSTALAYPVDTTIQEPVVVSKNYVYYVATCLGSSSLRLYGVRIDYEPAIFRDGFEAGNTSMWAQ